MFVARFWKKLLIDFGLILKSIWCPKFVQNEVGNQIGKMIGKKKGKRRVYKGQHGVQDGVMLGWKIEKEEGQKITWKKE